MSDPVTAPDMVSVIAKVIADNSVVIHEHPDYGELTASTLIPDEMARAVLAAISEAGTVEWGTGEGDQLMTWRDRGQAERQSASDTKSFDRGATWVHTNPPVVSRITFPWGRAR